MSANAAVVLEWLDPGKTYYQQKKFDCGNEKINKFVANSLKKQVRDGLSQCFVLLDATDSNRFIGFYTLCAFAINAPELAAHSAGSLPGRVPCSRLVMLGVDKNFQKRGLGKRLMKSVFQKTMNAAKEIGIYGLYLDADEDAYDFYDDLGFVTLQYKVDSLPTPMFMHIDTIRASMS